MRVCILCSEPRIQGSHSAAQTNTDRNASREMEEGGRKGRDKHRGGGAQGRTEVKVFHREGKVLSLFTGGRLWSTEQRAARITPRSLCVLGITSEQ